LRNLPRAARPTGRGRAPAIDDCHRHAHPAQVVAAEPTGLVGFCSKPAAAIEKAARRLARGTRTRAEPRFAANAFAGGVVGKSGNLGLLPVIGGNDPLDPPCHTPLQAHASVSRHLPTGVALADIDGPRDGELRTAAAGRDQGASRIAGEVLGRAYPAGLALVDDQPTEQIPAEATTLARHVDTCRQPVRMPAKSPVG